MIVIIVSLDWEMVFKFCLSTIRRPIRPLSQWMLV